MATLSNSLLLMIEAQYYQQVCECNDHYDCEESFFSILHEHSWTADTIQCKSNLLFFPLLGPA